MALRFDGSRIAKARKTPQGFVRVDARLTRVGVLEYRRADGSVQRELRTPEEVFKADSLATLTSAPVTERHPTEMVTPVNVRKLRVGGAGEARKDGSFVVSELQVEDADVIAKVDSGELQEISCGYHCKLDATPGVWQGQSYDAVQREITYNHVALGPKGWGRAGSEVSLRLDSLTSEEADRAANFDSEDYTGNNKGVGIPDTQNHRTQMLKVDGIEIKLDGAEAQTVEQAIAKRDALVAQLQSDAVAAKTAAESALAKATAERDVLKGKLDAATAPATVAAAVAARVSLEQSARKVLGADAKFDGKSDSEVRSAALAKACPELKLDGKDEVYVTAAFELATTGAVKTSLAAANVSHTDATRTDSADPVEAARLKRDADRKAAATK